MKITVVGAGYVGLVTGTCFAEIGNDVICVDIDEKKIEMLNQGKIPIYEPGLDELTIKNSKSGKLKFSTDLEGGIKESDVIFICVGTPPRPNGEADLSYVENVARTIAEVMDSYKVVVEKSTVPVQTGEKVKQTIKAYNKQNVEFDVVSNPEFLREGSAVSDFMEPDRVVVGCESEKARKAMEELYAPLKAKVLFTDIKSAEIIKHASNSFLATKISFINAVANICELAGANIEEVAEGMGLDKRIGKQFLNAGIGYGGSCFPKDVEAFVSISDRLGYDFSLLKEVQLINEDQKKHFITKMEKALWVLKNKNIGVLGLSFKPNTDDMRCAPSLDVIKHLLAEGANVKAYDPEAMERTKEFFPDITYCKNASEVAEDADALLLLTEWDEFKDLDLDNVKKSMKNPLILDGRNLFEPKTMKEKGFSYISIGRKDVL